MWLEYGNLQNMARLEAGLPRGCSSSRWKTTAWGWILSGAAGGQKSTGTLTLLPPRIRRTMQGAPPSESRWGMTDLSRKTWTRPAGSRRSTRACRTAAGRKDSHAACAQMPGVQLRPGTPRAWWPPEQGRHNAGQALWETAWHAGPWWTGTQRTTRSMPGRGAGRTSCAKQKNTRKVCSYLFCHCRLLPHTRESRAESPGKSAFSSFKCRFAAVVRARALPTRILLPMWVCCNPLS